MSALGAVQVVDTHEHLLQESERIHTKPDPFETFLTHYTSSDLVSSGMSLEELEKVRDQKISLKQRWKILKPYWEKIQNTGYARAINIATRDLYGIESINDDNYEKLASRMEESNKQGIYQWILKEKSGIDICVLDSLFAPLEEVDRGFFVPVMRFDDFAMVRERREIESLERKCGRSIHSFSDLIKALEFEFETAASEIVGIKIGLAYQRSLRFEKVSAREAEEIFNNIYNQEFFKRIEVEGRRYVMPEGLSLKETKPFQDFMVHKIIQLGTSRGLPIQIHTGLQEGNENIISNSNPTLLINLFREYKDTKFDIFHGAYPFTSELCALSKNFQNVYIDMCWLHIISPFRARQALSEWLDTVPLNKIFGFGGDYIFAEGVYGHLALARNNIARVLAEKVEEDSLGEKQAILLAQRLLRDNAYEFFNIGRYLPR